jgi:glycosyltransferase involved in cell wall biosynthesis
VTVPAGTRALRILAVLEAGDVYTSGTVRGLIYRELFARDGHAVRFVSRLHVPFVRVMNAPPRWLGVLLRFGVFVRLAERIGRALTRRNEDAVLALAKDVDVVYMSKVLSLEFVERMRRATAARVVLDFGDAVWLPRYGAIPFAKLLKSVDAVTTDNQVTAEFAMRFNPDCTVIPDCPQVEVFDEARSRARRKAGPGDPIVIGWIGTRSTAYNLYVAWEALERVFARHPNLELRLVGAERSDLPPFERIRCTWTPGYDQARMVEEVLKMDIGLFPLQDVEACRVRGVLKGTIYMSGEAVAVCSPVGQVPELIRDGVNGMLAATPHEWEEKIERLIADPALRARIAAEGLALVRSQFTVERSYRLLRSVLERPPMPVPADA